MNNRIDRTPVGYALARSHQLAYVTSDLNAAVAEFGEVFGFDSFRTVELEVILGVDEDPFPVHLTAAFADDDNRQIEIFHTAPGTPDCVLKPSGADDPAAPLLRFHHVGAMVESLDPVLTAARQAQLKVVRGAVPGILDIAFVDLTASLGHWLECLCRRA